MKGRFWGSLGKLRRTCLLLAATCGANGCAHLHHVQVADIDSTQGELQPFAGETQIFIFPGYRITSVDALITNFHLPESTLLMLVSAFAGRETMLDAYKHAVERRYRFFSYGDAMLIWPPDQETR